MQAEDISVIIPVYNTQRYLAEALHSVFAQTLLPREVIVVDDGSTDATPDVARAFAGRIRYVRQENGGSGAARNHGIALAASPLLAFLDADDRYLPRKLERQLALLRERPELDLCICHAQDFWSPELVPPPGAVTTFAAAARPGQASTWLARRRAFDKAGLFRTSADITHAEGSEWFLRARDCGVVTEELVERLVERRLHDANKTTRRADHLDAIAQLIKMRIDRRRSRP